MQVSNVFDEYPNPVFIIRPNVENGMVEDFAYIYVNKAFSIFLGRSRNELMGHTYRDVFAVPGEKPWLDSFKSAAYEKKHIYVERVSDVIGRKLYTEIFYVGPDMCACIIHDFIAVTEGVNKELRNKANHDYLTGFYNRFYLMELKGDICSKKNVGITYLDINNLKTTNDILGHAAGDDLIRKTSDLIRNVYKSSMVFRVGGDEFLIITMGLDNEKFAGLSEKSKHTFGRDNLAAIGYRFYEVVDDLEKCISQCDSLMYKQKQLMKRRGK